MTEWQDAETRIESYRRRARELTAPLPPLLVEAERVASVVAPGLHGRRRSGSGDSFWQFRAYQPGDPAYMIDWRRSAVSQRAYVREQEWETAQGIWLWRDGSASMKYKSSLAQASKLDRASLLTLSLVALLTRAGEQVALLGQGNRPVSGPGVVGRIATALVHHEATDDLSAPPIADIPRHAEMVWIGDFLGDLEPVERALRAYAGAGARGHLIQVLDPAEEDLPFHGRVRFEGVEAPDSAVIGRVEAVREAYHARLDERREHLRHLADRHRWTMTGHRTDRPPHATLLAVHAAIGGTAVEGGWRRSG